MAVWGMSAGGHLAALVGATGDCASFARPDNEPAVSDRVQAVIDFFGPSNVLTINSQNPPNGAIDHDAPNSPESLLLGGPVQERRELARSANPVTYAHAGLPPFLIVHGDSDTTVPVGQSIELERGLREQGVDATLLVLKDGGHGGAPFDTPRCERGSSSFWSAL
jgi:acetyl esterase/lipase